MFCPADFFFFFVVACDNVGFEPWLRFQVDPALSYPPFLYCIHIFLFRSLAMVLNHHIHSLLRKHVAVDGNV